MDRMIKANLTILDIYVAEHVNGSTLYYSAMMVLLSITVALNIVFNGTILFVILFTRAFHSTANLYICSLSISDLIFSIYSVYATIDGLSAIGIKDNFKSQNCFVKLYVLYLVALSSIWAMVAVAIDRYRSIVSPHKKKFTPKQCCLILLLVWLFSAGLATIPVSSYSSQQYKVDYNGTIYNVQPALCDSPKLYGYITESLFSYIIPLATISVLYSSIIKVLRKPSSVKSESSIRAKMTAVKMMLMIVICFTICWLPQCICLTSYFWLFGYKAERNITLTFPQFQQLLNLYDVFIASIVSVSCYSWLNAAIYIYFSSQFKQACKNVRKCRRHAIILDDETGIQSGISTIKPTANGRNKPRDVDNSDINRNIEIES
ncbi:unnamed protein product [Owenia fusiformis]|uniref:Uncharacterized protein n=1 Tax=Owenia fusiformis TaxID=6347 RepID=A0A8J1TCA2_OWEFU|nr:unnamed protein product [Owenia fusiformis]